MTQPQLICSSATLDMKAVMGTICCNTLEKTGWLPSTYLGEDHFVGENFSPTKC